MGGGRNAAARLKDGGLDVTKTDRLYAALSDIWPPPKGHPLYHPRFGDQPEREMVDSIKSEGVREDIIVREDPQDDGSRRLLLVDGARRTCAAFVAQHELGRPMRVPIRLFAGDDAAVLVERVRANRDPLKKPDAPSILALTVKQLAALGPLDVKDVAAAMGVKAAVVEGLVRWGSLCLEARVRFDHGKWPLELLPAVLDAPRERQVEAGAALIAAGVRTAKGASQRANKAREAKDPWSRRMSRRQATRLAADLGNAVYGGQDVNAALAFVRGRTNQHVAMAAAGIALGLRLAANEDVETILKEVHGTIADALRKARAAK